MTKEEVKTETQRCLFIYNEKIYHKGDFGKEHQMHSCGQDVTGLMPETHQGNPEKYLAPYFIAELCTGKKETCDNSVDDDLDGKTDCADPDCFESCKLPFTVVNKTIEFKKGKSFPIEIKNDSFALKDFSLVSDNAEFFSSSKYWNENTSSFVGVPQQKRVTLFFKPLKEKDFSIEVFSGKNKYLHYAVSVVPFQNVSTSVSPSPFEDLLYFLSKMLAFYGFFLIALSILIESFKLNLCKKFNAVKVRRTHCLVSVFATVFIFLHALLLLEVSVWNNMLSFQDVFLPKAFTFNPENPWLLPTEFKVFLGTLAFDLMILVGVTGALWKGLVKRIGIKAWRWVHRLAFGFLVLGLVHSVLIGSDVTKNPIILSSMYYLTGFTAIAALAFNLYFVVYKLRIRKAIQAKDRTQAKKIISSTVTSPNENIELAGCKECPAREHCWAHLKERKKKELFEELKKTAKKAMQ